MVCVPGLPYSRLLRVFGALLLGAIAGHGEWRQTGPYGGGAEVVRVDAGASGTVLAATRNGLLFRSTDSGSSWTPIPFPPQLSGILHAFEADPKRSGVWYAGMEGDAARTSGLYRTMDHGSTWTLLFGLQGKAVWSLAIWGHNPNVVAAGAADGVYLSRDSGETWRRISPESNLELRPVVSLAFHPASSDFLYAGTTHLPWRTVDGGASWQAIHTGMLDDSDVFSMHVDPEHPQVVYASACSGVYRSRDAGRLWTHLSTPPGAFRVYLVTLDPQKTSTVFAATSAGLLKSADSGSTFRKVSGHAVRSIAFDPSRRGRIYFASDAGGLLISADEGETLRESNDGFVNRTFTNLSGAGSVLYLSSAYEPQTGGLFRSDDFGASWLPMWDKKKASSPNILLVAPMLRHPRVVFAATAQGLLKSTDAGRDWLPVAGLPGDSKITGLLALSDNSGTLLAGTASGLFRTADAGRSWSPVALGPLGARRVGIRLLQGSGGSGVALVTESAALLSSDRGQSWSVCAEPLPGMQWYALAFDTRDGGTILAATSHGLFRSVNGCRSWSAVLSGLGSGTVSTVMLHPLHSGEFLAAQQGSVFRSTDGGQHWYPLGEEDYTGSDPSVLLVVPGAPGRVFALFPRRGVSVASSGSHPELPIALGKTGARAPAFPDH